MRRLAAAVVSVVGLLSACGGGGYGDDGGTMAPPAACTAASATATTSVSLSGMAFVPSCVKVAPGATVTFRNAESVAHTVTTDPAQPETFDSGTLSQGQQFTHTFASTPETVRVHCTFHPGMTATIFVQ